MLIGCAVVFVFDDIVTITLTMSYLICNNTDHYSVYSCPFPTRRLYSGCIAAFS